MLDLISLVGSVYNDVVGKSLSGVPLSDIKGAFRNILYALGFDV